MFFIISLFFIINKNIFCEEFICNDLICCFNKNVTIKNDNNEKLLIYSSGLTNRNIISIKNNENKYDYNFLKDLFYDLECPYFFNNECKNNSNCSIYIGLHISFNNLTKEVLDYLNNTNLKKLVDSYKKNDSLFCLEENEVEDINKKYLNYIINNNYQLYNNSSFKTLFLSEYLINQNFYNNFAQKNPNFEILQFSLIINEYKNIPFLRKKESMILNPYLPFCNKKFHVLFLINGKINNTDMKSIKHMINNFLAENNFLVSIIFINNNYKIIQNYRETLNDFLENLEEQTIDFNKLFINIKDVFKDDNIYMRKILIPILYTSINIDDYNNLLNFIEEQNIEKEFMINSNYAKNYLNFYNYDLFFIFDSDSLIFNNKYDFPSILTTTLCSKPKVINIKEENEIIYGKIQSENFIYDYYEISLKSFKDTDDTTLININLNITKEEGFPLEPYFNIYVSDTNSQPDYKDNLIKHYGINLYGYPYENGDNKIAKISFFTTKNISYISILSKNISYVLNISINESFSVDEEFNSTSNGLYESNNLTYTFNNYYKTYTNLDTSTYQETIFSNESENNFLNYYTMGIDNQNVEKWNGFFNDQIFFMFFMQFRFLYIESNQNESTIFFANLLNSNTYNLATIFEKTKNKILIGKLYPSFKCKSKDEIENALAKENIIFNDIEIKDIYNISREKDINDINKSMSNINCSFDELNSDLKMIIYLNYFDYDLYAEQCYEFLCNLNEENFNNYFEIKTQFGSSNRILYAFQNIILSYYKYLKDDSFPQEKTLINFYIGNDFILSNYFQEFFKNIVEKGRKMKYQFQLNLVDNKKIEKFFKFNDYYKTINSKIEDYVKTFNKKIKKDSGKMNLKEIFKHNKKIFDLIDNGIKKIMVVIYNEEINLLEYENFTVNHTLNDIEDIEYINKTQFILFSKKNYFPNGEKDEFFIKNPSFSIFKNYFYVQNYSLLPNISDNFLRKIMFSPIVIDCDSKILNDFFIKKNYVYEFSCPINISDTLHVHFESTESNFYYKISSILYSIEKDDEKYIKKGDYELTTLETQNQFYVEFINHGNEILTQFEFYLNSKNEMPKFIKIIILCYIILMIIIIFFLTNFGKTRN